MRERLAVGMCAELLPRPVERVRLHHGRRQRHRRRADRDHRWRSRGLASIHSLSPVVPSIVVKFELFELYSLLKLYELKNNIKFINSRMQIIACITTNIL